MRDPAEQPVGRQVALRGDFSGPVKVEPARQLPGGYVLRVRLDPGQLKEMGVPVVEIEELPPSLGEGAATVLPADRELKRLLVESARIRLVYTHDRQSVVNLSDKGAARWCHMMGCARLPRKLRGRSGVSHRHLTTTARAGPGQSGPRGSQLRFGSSASRG